MEKGKEQTSRGYEAAKVEIHTILWADSKEGDEEDSKREKSSEFFEQFRDTGIRNSGLIWFL